MAETVEELVKGYAAGIVTRREFIQRAVVLTGSLTAATSLLDSVVSPAAYAGQVDPNDPALVSGMVQFPAPAGTVSGYQSRPKAAGKYPAVIVIHANDGLDEHIQDVARRYAKEGFVALAVDYLSRHGGTKKVSGASGDIENISELAPLEVVKEDTDAAVKYLRGVEQVRGDRIGITGFCWGGGRAFYAATQVRGMRAVVVFYGRSPNPLDLVRQIEGPVLAHYGELDKRITDGVPETEAAMKRYGKSYEYKIYSGAGHGFFSDAGRRHHPEAAKEAWSRTLEFFKKHLT